MLCHQYAWLPEAYNFHFDFKKATFSFMKCTNMKTILNKNLILVIISLLLLSCKKFVDVDAPKASINGENVYSNTESAIASLNGIYVLMSQSNGSIDGTSLILGLSADEFNLWEGVTNSKHVSTYQNNLSTVSGTGSDFWEFLNIYRCNEAIEGLTEAENLNDDIRNQLLGEAKFLRAYFYFYLVNIFGDVPLILSTDYKLNSLITRSPEVEVYDQIVEDLSSAIELLSEDYLDGFLRPYDISAIDRVRPTKWSAHALLARVHLYKKDYSASVEEASIVINNSELFSLEPIDVVFQKTSREAIWQLQPTLEGVNTNDAQIFVIPETGPTDAFPGGHPVSLSESLLTSFDSTDQRRQVWVGSVTPADPGTVTYYYPFKYKIIDFNSPVTEYQMLLRLAEIYLIRAEAKAHLNDITGAQTDLNVIRTRAGLEGTTTNEKDALTEEIIEEKRKELFSEQGHRWLDLKRSRLADEVMSFITPLKGPTNWESYQQLYPIPQSDIDKNPNLVQNPGYE
jgi:starch-binding outer membrane protein, SusD/RagB family